MIIKDGRLYLDNGRSFPMTLEAVQVGDYIGSRGHALFSGYVTAIGERKYRGGKLVLFRVRRPNGSEEIIPRDSARIIEE